MSKHQEILITGVFLFLILACSNENPSGVFVNQSSEASSSSFFEDYSSSANITGLSSGELISSNNEISSSSWAPYSYGELIDNRDRHVYKTIKIGEQTWMAENLNFDYHNRYALTPALASPSSCYNNDPENCEKNGRLYSWSTAMDSAAVYSKSGQNCGIWSNNKDGLCKKNLYNYTRGACPENWHIPTDSDINNIVHYANTSTEKSDWVKHYWLYGGKDHSQYGLLSQYGYFWSSLEADSGKSVVLNATNSKIDFINELKQNTHFIRCVKDTLPLFHIEHGTMTDERDGQVYKTVKIGDQWWMAENLNYAHPHKFDDLDSASWCYNNKPDSCAKYGRLYMWEAAMDCYALSEYTDNYYSFCNEQVYKTEESFKFHRGICPENWHIPSYNEWILLKSTVNNFATDLKSTDDWFNNGNGSDILGFSALPAGECFTYSRKCYEAGQKTCFWTTKQIDHGMYDIAEKTWDDYIWASIFCLTANRKEISNEKIDKFESTLSVRCVKDSTESE